MTNEWRFLYRAKWARTIDGDTIEMTLDMGCKVYVNMNVRVADLRCAEIGTEDGRRAQQHGDDFFHQPTSLEWPFMVELHKSGDGEKRSFARYVGDIYNEDLISYAKMMRESGYDGEGN